MMFYPRQLFRLNAIYRVLIHYGLDEFLPKHPLLSVLRIFLYLTPDYWFRERQKPRGARIRLALEELGPIFVKFGQILSTRRDLLPDDIAVELAKLQDRVPPFPVEQARKILEQTYRKPLTVVFAEFDPIPLAAASIAQVHAAQLHDGREVVVKIVRPGIAPRIRKDVEVLKMLAELAHRYWVEGRRLHPREVVSEFEKHLYDELDLMREAGSCSLLRRNFTDSDLIYIPEVEWRYTTREVMVLERISGIPISDIETLRQHRVNFKRLAEIGVEVFFTQVFRDNFFHADMHPGNIFVDASNPEYPHYIAVDFGIMGGLSADDQHYLAENFLAFFRRDYRRVAELHVHSGWVPPGTRIEEFEGAIRSVCEPIFNRPLKEISFGMLLLRLFQTARRFNMEVQPQLVLLQKTLLNIEGLGRQLYPNLDLWQTAKPYLERWMSERIGSRAFIKGVQENFPYWLEKLPQLPKLVYEVLEQNQHERMQRQRLAQEIHILQQQIRRHDRRLIRAMIGTALLISGSIIIALSTLYVYEQPLLGTLLGGMGAMILLWLWK